MSPKPFVPPKQGFSQPKTPLRHVLYVEDEDVNWELAELALRHKYALQRAAYDRDAFRLIAEIPFDLILMDIQLSGSQLSGIDITKILRGTYEGVVPGFAKINTHQSLPIIFVTAYASRYSREELLEAGGDELIHKPVDFTKLALTMSRLLMRGLY